MPWLSGGPRTLPLHSLAHSPPLLCSTVCCGTPGEAPRSAPSPIHWPFFLILLVLTQVSPPPGGPPGLCSPSRPWGHAVSLKAESVPTFSGSQHHGGEHRPVCSQHCPILTEGQDVLSASVNLNLGSPLQRCLPTPPASTACPALCCGATELPHHCPGLRGPCIWHLPATLLTPDTFSQPHSSACVSLPCLGQGGPKVRDSGANLSLRHIHVAPNLLLSPSVYQDTPSPQTSWMSLNKGDILSLWGPYFSGTFQQFELSLLEQTLVCIWPQGL